MVVEEGLSKDLLKNIVSQLRAYDTYGTWDKRSDEDLLKEFLKKEEKTHSNINLTGHCAVDPKTMLKIYAYFKALGVTIEKLSGMLTSVVINIDDEGNGNVLIYSGRLILLNKTIRDANKFSFKSIEDMLKQGLKVINGAMQHLEKYEEVARQ